MDQVVAKASWKAWCWHWTTDQDLQIFGELGVQQNPKADVGPVVNLQMIRDFKVEMSFGFLYVAIRLEEQGDLAGQ